MTEADLRPLLRAAVTEHLRTWLSSDGVHIRRFIRSGRIDPNVLRRIAVEYSFSRGVYKGKAGEVASLLTTDLDAWPDDLLGRAGIVSGLAEQAKAQGLTNGVQLSGFSKLVWFLKPEGWTMFDSLARRALARPEPSIGFDSFYERLDQLEFMSIVGAMRGAVKSSAFPSLWSERIVDKYLMLCGKSADRNFIDTEDQDVFLAIQEKFFGSQFSEGVNDLTDRLLDVVTGQPLFDLHLKPDRREEA